MAKFSKICKCCGLPFETNSPQKLFCDRDHYLPCPVCGKPVLKKDKDFTKPAKCCSTKCTHELRKLSLPVRNCAICGEPFQPKSGVSLICEKEHHINCSICGKDMILTRRMWQDKIDTCSRECALEKVRRFYRNKYGVDHPMQCSEVQEHHKAAMKSKYGVEFALQKKEFMEAAQQTNLDKFGTKYACIRPECQSKVNFAISSENKRIGKMLSNMGLDVEYEKLIGGRMFDLTLPEYKVTIEIDPTYSHNSYDNHWHAPLVPDYHLIKTKAAMSEGYRCIHVYEWDSVDKIINMFKDRNKIGARQCEIRVVDKGTANSFLNKYHIQNGVRGQLYCLGLYYNSDLVEIMTFGKPRYDKRHDVELLRLCTSPDFNVVGGASKLFKHALDNHPEWNSVISYCDLAKFTGDVYSNLGMKLLRTTPPQVTWSKGKEKVTSTLLRQRGFDQIFKTDYGKGTSNEHLMIEHGWLPVYDCGQNVYVYERK